MSAPEPTGTAYCELTVRGRWAISRATGRAFRAEFFLARAQVEATLAIADELAAIFASLEGGHGS